MASHNAAKSFWVRAIFGSFADKLCDYVFSHSVFASKKQEPYPLWHSFEIVLLQHCLLLLVIRRWSSIYLETFCVMRPGFHDIVRGDIYLSNKTQDRI